MNEPAIRITAYDCDEVIEFIGIRLFYFDEDKNIFPYECWSLRAPYRKIAEGGASTRIRALMYARLEAREYIAEAHQKASEYDG